MHFIWLLCSKFEVNDSKELLTVLLISKLVEHNVHLKIYAFNVHLGFCVILWSSFSWDSHSHNFLNAYLNLTISKELEDICWGNSLLEASLTFAIKSCDIKSKETYIKRECGHCYENQREDQSNWDRWPTAMQKLCKHY